MTAKFLNNYPAKNAVRIISQNRKFAIVTCILSLLGIPLFLGSAMISSYLETLDDKNGTDFYYGFQPEPYMLIGGFCAAIAVLLGIFCGIRAFEEEWNKTRVDMLYSLPLNGTQRFFSDYLGGFTMYAVPYLVAVLLGWVIMLVMTPLIISNLTSDQASEVHEFYLYYFLGTLGLFVLMWMYYTISAVCASCCGTLFENIYTNLLLNLLLPGTFAAVLAVITYQVDGLDFEYSWDFIGYTSPIGGLIYLIYLLAEKGIDFDRISDYGNSYTGYGGSVETSGLMPAYLRWIFVIILLTAALLFLAWKLYQNRKAEQVSSPFVYIWLYYVIISAIVVCILCISAAEDDAIIAVILFSATVYFIMEVIRKRGFKKFWLSVVTYIVTVAVAIGGYILTISTDCFGRTKYIPAVSTVSSVEIYFNIPDYSQGLNYNLTYKDKETIQKIEEFHRNYFKNHDTLEENLQQIVEINKYGLEYTYDGSIDGYTSYEQYDEYDSFPYYRLDYNTFTISYHTIAGTTIHRSYQLYPDEMLDLMKICLGTDAYAESQGKLMRSRLLSDARKYNDKTHQYEYPYQYSFELFCFYSNTSDNSNQQIYISDTENTIRTFADIYQTDMKAMSFDEFCKGEIIGYIRSMPVYKSCTGTVAFLKEHGFTEYDLAEAIPDNQDSYYNRSKLDIRIYAPEQYKTDSLNYPSYLPNQGNYVAFNNTEDYAYCDIVPLYNISGSIQSYYPELYEVLSHAREHYISAEPCYLIYINGSRYLIPAEYSESVKKLIQHENYYYNNKSDTERYFYTDNYYVDKNYIGF